MDVQPGLYELLIDSSLEELLDKSDGFDLVRGGLDSGESHEILSTHLERLISGVLQSQVGEGKLKQQVDIYNRIVTILSAARPGLSASLNEDPQRLLEVMLSGRHATGRPDTPLSQGCILTRTRQDPTLESQLKKEIESADEIGILCSFIKWTGLRRIKDELEAFTNDSSKRLRVLTTSYMGATDVKAVDALQKMANTLVKVSYDGDRTRLHAKAYIFNRRSGFGTAYIGSSNISHAALTEGLEWNVKVSQYQNTHLWEKMTGAFETHWNSPEFESYSELNYSRLANALTSAGDQNRTDYSMPLFDLRPYPYQQEILDRIAAERLVNDRRSHLVVAATGTGKTLIAGFDYEQFCKSSVGKLPSLLFVAHREEILKQSLATFKAVLRDYNFGELCINGSRPNECRQLFMSVQTLNSLFNSDFVFAEDEFDYIVVDEFHHAAADSYQRLLDHFKPKCLLGLTATPERMDGRSVLQWFGGHITAQIRLPDAVNRKLLCPFQYFGVTDSIDLADLRWSKGGYETKDLEDRYTLAGHLSNARVDLICQKLDEIVLDPQKCKAIGFCVSVKHAEYMANAFNKRGLRSIAVTANTKPEDRGAVLQRLRSEEINYIFTVDLYNEGVDIPEIDTVLFLRPTESLTVFLQQLGRGLRHSAKTNKECLTVLDFIGQANRKYRFDVKYRALIDDPSRAVLKQVELGFPHLPAGCSIQLEKIAQQHILNNIKRSVTSNVAGLESAVREFYDSHGRAPQYQEFLTEIGIDPEGIYKYKTTWSRLLSTAGLSEPLTDKDSGRLVTGLRRIQHLSGVGQLKFLINSLQVGQSASAPRSKFVQEAWLTMAAFSLWGLDGVDADPWRNLERLSEYPAHKSELLELLQYRLEQTDLPTHKVQLPFDCPLELHARYTRDELLAGIGYWSLTRKPEMRQGVVYSPRTMCDLFLVTLNKTEADYSPTTMYADYAISDCLFHWQSQSQTSSTDPTGRRYINHERMGSTVLLCVREDRNTNGLSNPFYFLGPADFVSYEGSKPMSIIWKLRYPMPAKLLRKTATLEAA